MEIDRAKLTCVKSSKDTHWLVYLQSIPAIAVHVKDLDDAPKEIANMLESVLKYGFVKKIHHISNFNLDD